MKIITLDDYFGNAEDKKYADDLLAAMGESEMDVVEIKVWGRWVQLTQLERNAKGFHFLDTYTGRAATRVVHQELPEGWPREKVIEDEQE